VSDGLAANKSELRRRFRFERSQRSLGGDWLHLCTAREITSASTIASYISYGDEPDTSRLNQSIMTMGKRLVLPRTDDEGLITWIEWDETSKLEKGKKHHRHMQPTGKEFIGRIDVVICPALRVDRSGVRLGQGGGSYDRALKEDVAINSWKVALLHDEEVSSEQLPFEPHDVRVDAVALPEIVVRFKKIQ
jgi:5-formyltetrahydrofolate cyclo-ligase